MVCSAPLCASLNRVLTLHTPHPMASVTATRPLKRPLHGVHLGAPTESCVEQGGMPALIWLAKEGKVMGIKALLELEADINVVDQAGGTPLHYALQPRMERLLSAANGHLKMLSFLLDRSANVNAATKDGRTPLLSAASHQRSY